MNAKGHKEIWEVDKIVRILVVVVVTSLNMYIC